MASIEKRGENSYRITVCTGYDIQGRQIRRKMTYVPKAKGSQAIKREVSRAALLFEEQVKSGNVVDEKIKFFRFYEVWREEWAKDHLSLRTFQDYCRYIEKKALPVIGTMYMDKITSTIMQNLINDLKKHYQPASVHKIICAIDSVFRYAYVKRIIIENPLKRCTMPSIKGDSMNFFDADQAKRFLKAIQIPYREKRTRKGKIYYEYGEMQLQLQVYFFIAIYGGLRRGEIIALTWNDIDFKNHIIHISKATSVVRNAEKNRLEQIIKDPKTQSGVRSVMLPNGCFDMLSKWRRQEEQMFNTLGDLWQGDKRSFERNFVFIQEDGKQMSIWTPEQALKRFIKRYNAQCLTKDNELPDIRLHDLRHTNATLLLGNGVDIETVARRLGHRKASTTLDIYGHALPEKDSGASAKLAEILA